MTSDAALYCCVHIAQMNAWFVFNSNKMHNVHESIELPKFAVTHYFQI